MGPILRLVARPPLLGAAYVIGLVATANVRQASDDRDLGRQADELTRFVQTRFAGEITRVTVAVAAAAIVVGALLGTVAGLLVRVRDRLAARGRRSVASVAIATLAWVAALHAIWMLWSMADSPPLYASRWYAAGGVARTVQVFATDVLGPRGVLACGALVVAAWLFGRPARWPASLRRAWRSFAWVVPAAAGAAGLFALPSAASGEASAASGDRPNILLLAVDSLRADRIDPKIAPNLAKLAARGTTYERAYVSLPRTFPSWVTILTGRHPHHHGVRSMFPRWEERVKDFDALPERLARAGWKTGVVSDYAGDIFRRIDLGYQYVDTPTFDFRQLVRQRALERQTPLLPALHSRLGRAFFPVLRELNDAADPRMLASDATRALRAMEGGPFFLTVFFSTAHFPYAAPAPYYARFTDPAYRGRFKYHKPVGLGRDAPPDDADIRQIRGLYDGAVASVDDAIGEVLAALERRGLAQRTIVVLTADHGETLYEAGRPPGHGDHLFGDEGTHVPLVVVDPRRPGGEKVRTIARDVDLAPTLLDLAGVGAGAEMDGRSLRAQAPRLAFAETEIWFTEDAIPAAQRLPYPPITQLTELDAEHGDEIVLRRDVRALVTTARHRMVRDERYKLVYMPTRFGAKYMLFDTERDPAEVVDVAGEQPRELARLKGELWSWMLQDPEMEQRGGLLVPREGGTP
jgi:arylsulfatase A-like enzyme